MCINFIYHEGVYKANTMLNYLRGSIEKKWARKRVKVFIDKYKTTLKGLKNDLGESWCEMRLLRARARSVG
jgi:hypothetical protein